MLLSHLTALTMGVLVSPDKRMGLVRIAVPAIAPRSATLWGNPRPGDASFDRFGRLELAVRESLLSLLGLYRFANVGVWEAGNEHSPPTL